MLRHPPILGKRNKINCSYSKTRFRVTPKAPLRSKALDEVGGVCGEGLQDIVSLLAGS